MYSLADTADVAEGSTAGPRLGPEGVPPTRPVTSVLSGLLGRTNSETTTARPLRTQHNTMTAATIGTARLDAFLFGLGPVELNFVGGGDEGGNGFFLLCLNKEGESYSKDYYPTLEEAVHEADRLWQVKPSDWKLLRPDNWDEIANAK